MLVIPGCTKVIRMDDWDDWDITKQEEWRDTEYEGYKVSSYGRVMVYKKRKVLKRQLHKGYYYVSIKGKTFAVHRLVAKAFIPPIAGKDVVNHINGMKKDNRVCNLEWVTELENRQHAIKTGLAKAGVDGKPIYNWKTNEQFESIRDAARKTGKNEKYISDCLHGRRPSGGWEFIKNIGKK